MHYELYIIVILFEEYISLNLTFIAEVVFSGVELETTFNRELDRLIMMMMKPQTTDIEKLDKK